MEHVVDGEFAVGNTRGIRSWIRARLRYNQSRLYNAIST